MHVCPHSHTHTHKYARIQKLNYVLKAYKESLVTIRPSHKSPQTNTFEDISLSTKGIPGYQL